MKKFLPKAAISLIIMLFLIAGGTGALHAEIGEDSESDAPPIEILLRLHGSNTIGARLVPALATAYLKEELGVKNVRVQTDTANELILLADTSDGIVGIEIYSHGSTTAFKDLLSERCDIGMASRQIKDKEKEELAHLGDMGSSACEHVLGLDGIAVIVHKNNPISSMPIEAIRDIFTGKISNWDQLPGGIQGRIEVHARDNKSGTYDTFKSIVLSKESPLLENAIRHESNSKLSDTVSNNPLAIGFTGLPYILRAKALSLADISSPPIFPDSNTVATEDYALSRRLYLYTPAKPVNKHTKSFIDFALSNIGQRLVADSGFVDQNIKTFVAKNQEQLPPQKDDVVKQIENATKKLERATMNFRFHPNSIRLDNRAEQDLLRLTTMMKNEPQRQIVLVGFSDSDGDYDANMTLSTKRAQVLQDRLRQLEVKNDINIISGGEELPVAANSNDKGKEKNRRVEVWIGKGAPEIAKQ